MVFYTIVWSVSCVYIHSIDAQVHQQVGLSGGAFAVPHSEFGFTLLATHPKREYSLEMDGSRTLADLVIAKFATLPVMRYNERGMVKRADHSVLFAGCLLLVFIADWDFVGGFCLEAPVPRHESTQLDSQPI